MVNYQPVLARTTEPSAPRTVLTEANTFQPPADDDSEDELSPEQPRLSLANSHLGENEDSFDAPPPRLSIPLGDDEQTLQSIEVPRRAEVRGRLSPRSSGDAGLGDRFTDDRSHKPTYARMLDMDIPLPLENELIGEDTPYFHLADLGFVHSVKKQ